jgi:hypothetical protein
MPRLLQPLGGGQRRWEFLITPEGKHGTYLDNVLFANPEHRLAKAFAGDLDCACILGTSDCGIGGLGEPYPVGQFCRSPSAEPGGYRCPPDTTSNPAVA